VTRKFDPRDQFALDLLQQSGTKAFLILNKVDLLREQSKLLPGIEEYRNFMTSSKSFLFRTEAEWARRRSAQEVISALPRDLLISRRSSYRPASPFMASEIIREQVLMETEEEIPYASHCGCGHLRRRKKMTRISATIYCERDGQKEFCWQRGQMLKRCVPGRGCRWNVCGDEGLPGAINVKVPAGLAAIPGVRARAGLARQLSSCPVWRAR